MQRHRVIAAYARQPWAMMLSEMCKMEAVLLRWAAGGEAPPAIMDRVRAEAEVREARRAEAARAGGGNIAVLPLYGVMSQRANMTGDISGSGGTSTQVFGSALKQALADPSIGGIVIDIDSPGGSVYGTPELANQIMNGRALKPIYGIANSVAASAAYWVGSSCSQLFCTPGGEVGSIGVYTAHQDMSEMLKTEGIKTTLISAGKFKTEGSPYAPLTDDALAYIQSEVDSYYADFTKAVARGRGVPISTVRDGMGQGRMMRAGPAKAAFMIDDEDDIDGVVNRMAKAIKAGPRTTSNSSARVSILERELDLDLGADSRRP